MSREMPMMPMIFPAASRNGIFVLETQVDMPVLPVLPLLLVNHRLAGGDDSLLVGISLACVFFAEDVEIGLSLAAEGSLYPFLRAYPWLTLDEAAVPILEINNVWRGGDQIV